MVAQANAQTLNKLDYLNIINNILRDMRKKNIHLNKTCKKLKVIPKFLIIQIKWIFRAIFEANKGAETNMVELGNQNFNSKKHVGE